MPAKLLPKREVKYPRCDYPWPPIHSLELEIISEGIGLEFVGEKMAGLSKDATSIWSGMSSEDENAMMEKFRSESTKVIDKWSLGLASITEKDAAASFLVHLGAVQITIQPDGKVETSQQAPFQFGGDTKDPNSQETADLVEATTIQPTGSNLVTPATVTVPIQFGGDKKETQKLETRDIVNEKSTTPIGSKSITPATVTGIEQTKEPSDTEPFDNDNNDEEDDHYSAWMMEPNDWDDDEDNQNQDCASTEGNKPSSQPREEHPCPDCHMILGSTWALDLHRLNDCPNIVKPQKCVYNCDQCTMSFKQKQGVTQHLIKVHGMNGTEAFEKVEELKSRKRQKQKEKVKKLKLKKRKEQERKQVNNRLRKERIGPNENEIRRSKRICVRLQKLDNDMLNEHETVDVSEIALYSVRLQKLDNDMLNEHERVDVSEITLYSGSKIKKLDEPKAVEDADKAREEKEIPKCESDSELLIRDASEDSKETQGSTEQTNVRTSVKSNDELEVNRDTAEPLGNTPNEKPVSRKDTKPSSVNKESLIYQSQEMLQKCNIENRKGDEELEMDMIQEHNDSINSGIEITEIQRNEVVDQVIDDPNEKEATTKSSEEVTECPANTKRKKKSKKLKEKSAACPICDMVFATYVLRERHMLKTHEKSTYTQYQCKTCGKIMTCKLMFKFHVETHMDIAERKRYFCEMCDKSYLSDSAYRKHMKVHEETNPYKCPTCGLDMSSKANLKRHIDVKHIKEVKYTCKVCGKKLYSTSRIKHHEKSHNLERKYKCDECDKWFLRKCDVRIHKENVHSDSVGCICEICGAVLKTQLTLKQHHLTVHNDDWKFPCKICGKKFKRSSHRNAHMIVHSDDPRYKPAKCEICGKGFRNSDKLQVHMNWHNNIRAYTCEVCAKSFLTKGNLTKHMNTHGVR